MNRKLLVVLALPLVAAACASEPEEEEMPVVDSEVFVPSEEAQQPAALQDGETLEPTGRSLADEAETGVTAPASKATGKIQPIDRSPADDADDRAAAPASEATGKIQPIE